MGDTVQEIEDALTAAEKILPVILTPLSMFFPQLTAVMKYLQLLPIAIQAVDTVGQVTGRPGQHAVDVVAAHLTPGAPNAPALDQQAATG